jgi:anti-sigma regulatory factor (Ser/Thr protein kinase)
MSAMNEATFRLSRRSKSVPGARALAQGVLHEWGVAHAVAEHVQLVLSELVTNALRARAPQDRVIAVRIVRSVDDGLLRLEVSDVGAGQARTPSA